MIDRRCGIWLNEPNSNSTFQIKWNSNNYICAFCLLGVNIQLLVFLSHICHSKKLNNYFQQLTLWQNSLIPSGRLCGPLTAEVTVCLHRKSTCFRNYILYSFLHSFRHDVQFWCAYSMHIQHTHYRECNVLH